ncbi:hypothetical protein E8E14_015067 [Neopestalotiopsis sp. 37M]|nr:hypothetical protein E8E14_015067 [Neopestalotiopsis sp. 37M]
MTWACADTDVLGRRPIDRRLNPLDHISLLNSNNERFWEDAAPQERIARDPTTLNAKQRLVLDLYVERYQQILAGNNRTRSTSTLMARLVAASRTLLTSSALN